MSPTATATPGTSKVAKKKSLEKLRWGYKKSSPRNSKKSLKSNSGSSNSDKENQIPGTPELASKISMMTTPKNSPGISKKTPKSSSRTPKRILRSSSGSSNSDKENQIPETSGLASEAMSPIPGTSKMASKIISVSSDSDKENQPGTSAMTPKILKMSPNGTLRISEMSPRNTPRTPKMGPKSRVFRLNSEGSSDSDKENGKIHIFNPLSKI